MMIKDLFIDNSCSKHFCNPVKQQYKDLINWIFNDPDAHLNVSTKLIAEYHRSNLNSTSGTSLPSIVDFLTRNHRLLKIPNTVIRQFVKKNFKKKRFRSNYSDHEYIVVVVHSNRKLALTEDRNLAHDLGNYSGVSISVADCPSKINYS